MRRGRAIPAGPACRPSRDRGSPTCPPPPGPGRGLRAVAPDGYAVDIPPADLETFPVILAVKRDGKYLGIGGRGPIWVVYPREDFPELQRAKDDDALIWSVFVILVE